MRINAAAVLAGVVLAGCRPVPSVPPGSPGCGSSAALAETLDVDGVQRTYVVELPRGYDPGATHPLVYGFHGNWDSGQGAQEGYRITEHWPDAIAIYPDGLREREDGPTTWAFAFPSRDSAFFDTLHATVRDGLCVDEARVFAIGYSSGAFMANSVACTRALAGVAAISGGVGVDLCEAPVPAWLEHGDADEVVPPERGHAARELWVRTNGCNPDPGPHAATGCVTFRGGDAPVVWCTHPQGHVLRPDSPRAALAFLRGLASEPLPFARSCPSRPRDRFDKMSRRG